MLMQMYIIVMWGFCRKNVNFFHLVGDWILLSCCGHYLPRIKITHSKNLCILSVILKLFSAWLSILIEFNWSADENKIKSGLTEMAKCLSESLIHFYLSLVMIFWLNLTEVIKQSLLRITFCLHTGMEIRHRICHLNVITILIGCS